MAEAVRDAVHACGGGHATLIRGSEQQRSELAVFQPQAAALAALSNRIKTAFDPQNILNPGKMGEMRGGA